MQLRSISSDIAIHLVIISNDQPGEQVNLVKEIDALIAVAA